jgi:hypothetical protein
MDRRSGGLPQTTVSRRPTPGYAGLESGEVSDGMQRRKQGSTGASPAVWSSAAPARCPPLPAVFPPGFPAPVLGARECELSTVNRRAARGRLPGIGWAGRRAVPRCQPGDAARRRSGNSIHSARRTIHSHGTLVTWGACSGEGSWDMRSPKNDLLGDLGGRCGVR